MFCTAPVSRKAERPIAAKAGARAEWAPAPAAAPLPVQRLAPAGQSVADYAAARASAQHRATPNRTGNRTGLPDGLRNRMEALSGIPLDDVRVHHDSPRPAQLQALAHTQGSEIHLGPGQERHLPHEAWHVVQQKQGRVRPTMALGGTAINDDAGLEREADRMGAQALARTAPLHPPVHAEGNPIAGGPARTTGAPVAQRRLDDTLIGKAPHSAAAVAALAATYNAKLSKKKIPARVNQLEAVHVAILQALEATHVADLHASPDTMWLKSMLGAVQTEHEALIQLSIAKNAPNPPVADFHTLSATDQTFVRDAWTRLTQGTGNIQITENEDNSAGSLPATRAHPGFRVQVLAQFARLLKTDTGRDIVGQIEDGGKPLTVKPGYAKASGGFPGRVFAAGPTDSSGDDKLTEFDIKPELAKFKGKDHATRQRQGYKNRFVPLDLDGIDDPKERAAAIYAARRDNPKKLGLKIDNRYYKFGGGTGVDVTITRDVRDDADDPAARFVDDARDEIPVPNFITLGHELGHAVHMMSGVALGDPTVSDRLLDKVDVKGKEALNWSDMEEYANINSVENRLRADYGLRARFGHINQPFVQKQRLEPVVSAMDKLWKLMPLASRAAVKKPLDDAANDLAGLKIDNARAGIITAAQAFKANLATAFPGFTSGERKDINKRINSLIAKVRKADEAPLADAKDLADKIHTLTDTAQKRVIAAAPPPLPGPAPKKPWSFWRLVGY